MKKNFGIDMDELIIHQQFFSCESGKIWGTLGIL
jgi:hypothetical protein